jgi:hypothetical protein
MSCLVPNLGDHGMLGEFPAEFVEPLLIEDFISLHHHGMQFAAA